MNLVVLISGNGSNLQAIIDANIPIAAVISNEPNALGLSRAHKANIPTHIINHRNFSSRDEFDQHLQKQIDHYQPNLIVLAGFMRRLGTSFIAHYENKMINIHPSLLPKYPGLHTHRQVLENQDKAHGITIHVVTDDLDAGPIIAQKSLTVYPSNTEEELKARIQTLEHQLYPDVIKRLIAGRIIIKNGLVLLNDEKK